MIGPMAAAATMPTATRTQTTTMIVPRRRSAAFCLARICSTTFWRSLRAVLEDLAMGALSASGGAGPVGCAESTE